MPSSPSSSATASARLSAVSRHLSSPPSSSSGALTRPKAVPPRPDNYRYFLPFQTSWRDNDSYGHLNNAVYQQYFDSIINHYLLHHAYPSAPSSSSSSPSSSAPEPSPHPIGLITSSTLSYASSLSYPFPVVAALAISTLGRRSVQWSIALFAGEYIPALKPGEVGGFEMDHVVGKGGEGAEAGAGRRIKIKGGKEAKAAAWGKMVHVFVNQDDRKVIEGFDDGMREALERLVVSEGEKEE
ncbi:hypothetical protein JCM11251_002809 [Rhodosporidiobolus azoricus]